MTKLEELSKAISILNNSVGNANSSGNLKEEAMNFCNQLKSSPSGWKLCIAYTQESSDPQIRFFCYQVIEDCLKSRYQSLQADERLEIKSCVWGWIKENVSGAANPFYLRNKLYLLLVLLFKNEYPVSWPSFFDDFFNLIELNGNEFAIETFLHTFVILDDEVIGHYIQKTPQQQELNNIIKDAMRDSVVPRLITTWHSIFITYYKSNKDLALLCIKLFGLYVAWVDIFLVIKPDFIRALYESLSNPDLCSAAIECLGFIIGKGMRPSDKIAMIQNLNIISVLNTLHVPSDQEDFQESVAKLINVIGLELVLCMNEDSTIPPLSDSEKALFFSLIDALFPLTLKYLANEYDDTSCALFPFIGQYLTLLKRLKKSSGQLFATTERLSQLLEVLAIKMKYDEEVDYTDASEEEALFIQMRKELKVPFDAVATLDYDLFTNAISQFICRTFQICKESGGNFANIKWADAELALYLTYIFVEGKGVKGSVLFVSPDGSRLTPLGMLLSQLVESGISSHTHPSVSSIYFEVLNRYAGFFEKRTDYIPAALQSFLDTRGLFHTVKPVRLRANYLFLKFVKSLKKFLVPYVEGMLTVLQELLVVPRRPIQTVEDISKTGDFDSQLFVFEAVGYLISLDSIPPERQEGLLIIVITPILRRVEEIVQYSQTAQLDLVTVAELGDLISSIGCIAKGFPDMDKLDSGAAPFWAIPFKTTLQGILIVLSNLNRYPSIRSTARFTFQRMAGCMGPSLLEYIPAFLSSGLLSSETAGELIDFLPFIGLTIYKLQHSTKDILVKLWKPLREKINFFLSQPPVGTDDVITLINLRKADLSLITGLFTSGLDDILTAPENIADLNNTLNCILNCLDEFSDSQTLRVAFSLLGKICYCWGGAQVSPAAAVVPVVEEAKPAKPGKAPKEVLRRSPLAGFDSFILERIVPLSFSVVLRPKFTVTDGQSTLVVNEITVMHCIIFELMGSQYQDYLCNVYLPTLNCPENIRREFASAIAQKDRKVSKKIANEVFCFMKKQQ